jgi:non-specific serine/threonine protein kinase/serine/threonine-protein kinase
MTIRMLRATQNQVARNTAGPLIGPYELVERIGVGGMGEVWLADQHHPVRRRVAIKLIKAGMDTREVVARLVSGRPITEYCNQTKLTIRQRLQLFILVCEGVQHAHQKAIIHRDLKLSIIAGRGERGRRGR